MVSDVPPSTVGIELTEGGVAVEYLDGRETFYAGVPQPTDAVRAPGGKEVHVLVTDDEATRGVLLYVNDRRTPDGVLEDSGVGRVLVGRGETNRPIPGIEIEREGYVHQVRVASDALDGRAFVFVEDEITESRFELVADPDEDGEA